QMLGNNSALQSAGRRITAHPRPQAIVMRRVRAACGRAPRMRTCHEQTMLQTRYAPVADTLHLAPGVELAWARAHEAFGPGRVVFAALAAARARGPVLWLRLAWAGERPTGSGLAGFLDPGRIV